MLQDIGPGRYNNHFSLREVSPEDYALVYAEDAAYAWNEEDTLRIPRFSQLPDALQRLEFRYGFSIDEKRYFFADAGSREEGSFLPSRQYRNGKPQTEAFALCVGESLHRWRISNRFCGRCAAPMGFSTKEQALVCPVCGQTVYPKICPAVIVAVCSGDRLLLTKYSGRAFQRFALIAGFHEIGETIEETVHREVWEETGLRVKNLRFYKSQPWVLTDSLLMGFFCQLDGDDLVTLQEDELSLAQWFSREELPDDHSGISLTGEIIEVFRRGEDPFRTPEGGRR